MQLCERPNLLFYIPIFIINIYKILGMFLKRPCNQLIVHVLIFKPVVFNNHFVFVSSKTPLGHVERFVVVLALALKYPCKNCM